MINLSYSHEISAIFLTVTLLIYLLAVELSESKRKKAFIAPLSVLIAVFGYIAIKYVYIQFTK